MIYIPLDKKLNKNWGHAWLRLIISWHGMIIHEIFCEFRESLFDFSNDLLRFL